MKTQLLQVEPEAVVLHTWPGERRVSSNLPFEATLDVIRSVAVLLKIANTWKKIWPPFGLDFSDLSEPRFLPQRRIGDSSRELIAPIQSAAGRPC